MAEKKRQSVKHALIDKDNSRTLVAVAAAVFVVIFCLFSLKALISQSNFHRRVIKEKEATLSQLKKNKQAVDDLRKTYTAFVDEQQNILGGNADGDGPIDGDNAQLIIDALPGKYDFPALSSSIEKILKDGGYRIDGIGGSDEGMAMADSSGSAAAGASTAVEIPYSFSTSSSLEGIKTLLQTLEHSIRPMHVTSISLQGGDSGLRSSITLKTYFASGKTFQLGSKEVK